jgi:hypothetical protein
MIFYELILVVVALLAIVYLAGQIDISFMEKAAGKANRRFSSTQDNGGDGELVKVRKVNSLTGKRAASLHNRLAAPGRIS